MKAFYEKHKKGIHLFGIAAAIALVVTMILFGTPPTVNE